MLNRVVLVGRLVKDPELNHTASGLAVAKITVAVNRPFSNQQGNREADFINCVVWRKQAENVSTYLSKGSLVGIDGRLQTRNYENNEGRRVFITEVVVDSVQFLESKNKNNTSPSPGAPPPPNNYGGDDPFANDGKPIDISDDDLPF